MTINAQDSLRMQRAHALQRSEGVALGAAVVFGCVAALSWLAVALVLTSRDAEADALPTSLVLWLAVAVTSSTATAAFAAARLVLLGLARSQGAEL
jgi:hypothetical protein